MPYTYIDHSFFVFRCLCWYPNEINSFLFPLISLLRIETAENIVRSRIAFICENVSFRDWGFLRNYIWPIVRFMLRVTIWKESTKIQSVVIRYTLQLYLIITFWHRVIRLVRYGRGVIVRAF